MTDQHVVFHSQRRLCRRTLSSGEVPEAAPIPKDGPLRGSQAACAVTARETIGRSMRRYSRIGIRTSSSWLPPGNTISG